MATFKSRISLITFVHILQQYTYIFMYFILTLDKIIVFYEIFLTRFEKKMTVPSKFKKTQRMVFSPNALPYCSIVRYRVNSLKNHPL